MSEFETTGQPEENREPWELAEMKEGFDVYNYDEARARRGQRVVIVLFLISLGLFVLYMYKTMSYRTDSEEQPQRSRRLAPTPK